MLSGRRERAGRWVGLAILLGTVLDGIPESIELGLSLLGSGGVSVPMLAVVFLSNLPEALLHRRIVKERLATPEDLGSMGVSHRGECDLGTSRLCLLRWNFRRDDRLRPVIRGWSALEHAGRHDDAGGIQVRRQAGRPSYHPGVRPRLLHHHNRVKGELRITPLLARSCVSRTRAHNR